VSWKVLEKKGFLSPGKPWNLVFASPGKSWKKHFNFFTNPGCRKGVQWVMKKGWDECVIFLVEVNAFRFLLWSDRVLTTLENSGIFLILENSGKFEIYLRNF